MGHRLARQGRIAAAATMLGAGLAGDGIRVASITIAGADPAGHTVR